MVPRIASQSRFEDGIRPLTTLNSSWFTPHTGRIMTSGSRGLFYKVLLLIAVVECNVLAARSPLQQADHPVRGLYRLSKSININTIDQDTLFQPFNGSRSFPVAQPTNESKTNQSLRMDEDVECDGKLYGHVLWKSCQEANEMIPSPGPRQHFLTFASRDLQSHRVKWDLVLPRRFLSSESGSDNRHPNGTPLTDQQAMDTVLSTSVSKLLPFLRLQTQTPSSLAPRSSSWIASMGNEHKVGEPKAAKS